MIMYMLMYARMNLCVWVCVGHVIVVVWGCRLYLCVSLGECMHLCVCMFVWVCMFGYVCMCVCGMLYVRVSMCDYGRVWLLECMYIMCIIPEYKKVHIYIHTSIYKYGHACLNLSMCMHEYMNLYIYIRIQVCTHLSIIKLIRKHNKPVHPVPSTLTKKPSWHPVHSRPRSSHWPQLVISQG